MLGVAPTGILEAGRLGSGGTRNGRKGTEECFHFPSCPALPICVTAAWLGLETWTRYLSLVSPPFPWLRAQGHSRYGQVPGQLSPSSLVESNKTQPNPNKKGFLKPYGVGHLKSKRSWKTELAKTGTDHLQRITRAVIA